MLSNEQLMRERKALVAEMKALHSDISAKIRRYKHIKNRFIKISKELKARQGRMRTAGGFKAAVMTYISGEKSLG